MRLFQLSWPCWAAQPQSPCPGRRRQRPQQLSSRDPSIH